MGLIALRPDGTCAGNDGVNADGAVAAKPGFPIRTLVRLGIDVAVRDSAVRPIVLHRISEAGSFRPLMTSGIDVIVANSTDIATLHAAIVGYEALAIVAGRAEVLRKGGIALQRAQVVSAGGLRHPVANQAPATKSVQAHRAQSRAATKWEARNVG
jgi:hypothetical protein